MKKITILLVTLLYCLVSQAQDELHGGELYIVFVNKPTNWEFTVKIEAYGTVWDHYHDITTSYPGGDTTYSSTAYPQPLCHASDFSWDDIGYIPVLSLGLYEVSFWEGYNKRAWFFLDMRTSHLPDASILGNIDVELEYDVINKELELTYPNLGQVVNGTHYTIWGLKNFVELQTDDLELYLNVYNQNHHPYLEWNEYHDSNILGYNIYRKITLGAGGNQTNVIFTTSTSFLDENFVIGPPKNPGNDQVEYWIKAKISSSQESLEGNHVQVVGSSIIQWKISDEESNDDLYYNLKQNYPNPFNPSTAISWQSPVDDFVTLKVFDVLGREVGTLVDEFKESGSYSIEFNASELSTGIYLYRIQIGSYIETRKLVLQK